MARPLWFVNLIKKGFPRRFFVAELTRLPLLKQVFDWWLFKGDDLVVLSRDNIIRVDETIAGPENTVLPSIVADHFIKKAGYHWIMNKCICRDSMQCNDYPIDLGCIFLGKAALGINPALGRRVTMEEALEHARRCREAGLVHLVGRNRLDAVWLNVGPGEKLLTMCNCCPCCCLWRILPHVAKDISDKVHRLPGVRVFVTDACAGCGVCASGICIADAVTMKGDVAVISDACRGCGRCVEICDAQAIEISVDEPGYADDLIERLSRLVDVT